jgi:hypothetical protein
VYARRSGAHNVYRATDRGNRPCSGSADALVAEPDAVRIVAPDLAATGRLDLKADRGGCRRGRGSRIFDREPLRTDHDSRRSLISGDIRELRVFADGFFRVAQGHGVPAERARREPDVAAGRKRDGTADLLCRE